MIPPDFNSKVVLVIKKISYCKIVLRDRHPIKVPILCHVGLVVCYSIEQHEVITLRWISIMTVNMNVAFGIPIAVVAPRKGKLTNRFWCWFSNILSYRKTD